MGIFKDILFGDDSASFCQKIRRLVVEEKFPPPAIPAKNGSGCAYWATPVVQKWYMGKIYEDE